MRDRFEEIKGLNLPQLEEDILARWERERIFQRCLKARAGAPVFSFYEGPPTANGQPGIHHVLGRTIKDIFCRYRTMKGYRVERKAGWDTHGLPVEIEVEKELGLEGRNQVEQYGIARYNAACRASVLRYKEDWDRLTRRLGYWVDLEHPYITFESRYIESVWWLVKQLHAQGLLYKGYKIQWYSPGSETVLSSHEVSLGYEEVDDPSVYVRFPSASEPDISFLAWTTTPWTLISNAALAVHPDIDYVKARDPKRAGAYLILARERLSVLGAECEIVATFRGAELAGERYRRLFELPANGQDESRAFRVVTAEFVSIEEGTGIVHIAPAFGADDYEVGRREGLPLYNPIRPDGRFSDAPGFIAGKWFKDADGPIMRDLEQRGLLFRQETYRHNYPHDWRKGTPLMSYPVESWFIRTTAKKDRLVALNNTIRWYPPAIGSGRFGDWLENNVDWALSRKRYWGTPLPIWISDRPGSEYFEVIGSIAELREKCGRQLPPDDEIDLHRPFVDELTWPAPDGGTMRRVPDVMDVWFDSGAMPYAQWHYPFENEDAFRRNFPADFIAEGLDQTRGWFYTLHAIAVLVSDSVAFRNVVVNGLVLDENGEKMSKSKGNTVDPFAAIAEHGADVLRWYMTANSPPWESMKFSLRGLTETRNRFFNTLANVYAFMASYANIDGFRYGESRIPVSGRAELDRWIMSRLNSTIAAVDAAFADYDPTAAARAIENFVDDLSNWYIRRSRRRFWKTKQAGRGAAASDQDKTAAYQTTFECLLAVAKLMAPLAPFFADWLYRALTAVARCEPHDSVHLADFPAIEASAIDHDLEQRMALARRIVAAVLLLRNRCKYNVRQPLSRILLVTGAGGVDQAIVERVRDVILDEVNVEAIEYIRDSSGIVRHSAKPNFPRLGPRVGKLMGALNRIVRALDHATIQRYLDSGGLDLEVDGQTVRLKAGDLEITSEPLGDWLVAQEDGLTVALDTAMTDELFAKGLARESVNRIQNMRKAMDLNLTDRIAIEYRASARLDRAIRAHAAWIRNETLALELRSSDSPSGDHVRQFEIDEEKLSVAIRRVSQHVADNQPVR